METSIWTEEDWTQEKLRFSEVCLHLDRHFQFRQRDHPKIENSKALCSYIFF